MEGKELKEDGGSKRRKGRREREREGRREEKIESEGQ